MHTWVSDTRAASSTPSNMRYCTMVLHSYGYSIGRKLAVHRIAARGQGEGVLQELLRKRQTSDRVAAVKPLEALLQRRGWQQHAAEP